METGFRKWIIVVTVVFCCLLELIDTSIVNVALTQMMGNLSATQQEVSWVVAAYAIANVIVIPMTGFLAEQFGQAGRLTFLSRRRTDSWLPASYVPLGAVSPRKAAVGRAGRWQSSHY